MGYRVGYPQIVDTIPQIQRKIDKAISELWNRDVPRAIPYIEQDLAHLKQIFVNSPEYNALINGPLDADFGIPIGTAINRLDKIIDKMIDSIQVKFIPANTTLTKGGIAVSAFYADFSDILKLSEGTVVSDKGFDIDWLEWLLLRGNQIIIAGHHVTYGNFSWAPWSRSKKAVMTKNGFWRVPPQFSGVKNDNWITRAVDSSVIFWQGLIETSLERNIKRVI